MKNKQIKYLDLKAINAPHEEEIKEEIAKVVESGWYLQGENINKFEKNYAQMIGTQYCISCANGTDALKLMLKGEMVLGKLKKGDEVIVPANTFFATVLAISSVGLTPILVDADKETLQIDDHLIEESISSKTQAILIVHMYGKLAATEKIFEICRTHHLLLLEDNAQAFGCSFLSEDLVHKTGSLGDAAAHSFYPSKNLGALGDAGAITTNNKELAEVINALHEYGKTADGIYEYKGVNSRMDEIQAAVLNVKLKYPNEEHEARNQQAKLYLDCLNPEIASNSIPSQLFTTTRENVIHIFPFLTNKREKLRKFLNDNGVETKIHYIRQPFMQPCYPEMNSLQFPVAKKIANEEISLPCNSSLKTEDIERISQLINRFYEEES